MQTLHHLSQPSPIWLLHSLPSTISTSKPSPGWPWYAHSILHLANSSSCYSSPLEWHFLRQACLCLPPPRSRVPFTIIASCNYVFYCSLPSPWGLLRTTSAFFITVSSAHHTGRSTIRKYLLHNWPSESPLAKVLFFPSFYFHIISYFQEQFCRWWFLCAFSTFSRALPMQSLLVWG